jgi:hypothetical protein
VRQGKVVQRDLPVVSGDGKVLAVAALGEGLDGAEAQGVYASIRRSPQPTRA